MSKHDALFDRLMAIFQESQIERISRSYCLAMRPERQHRLRTIMALSVELDRIKKVSIFRTGLAEGAIEAVIEGDWKRAEVFTSDLLHDDVPEFRKLWEPFIVLLQTAIAEADRAKLGEEIQPS